MYFTCELHEQNYNHLINVVFPHAKSDSEYNSMAYILALPDIYRRCINDPMLKEFPFLWTAKYKDTSYTGSDDDGEYLVIDFEVEKDENGEEVESENFATLSSGFRKLVDLAANLFNSSNKEFNLMNALGTWDDRLLKVYFQAVQLRLSRREIEGLTIDIN